MKHRLLCCSDTHGEAPPPLDDATASAWLHAGDLYEGPTIVGRGDDAPPLPGDPIAGAFTDWVKARRAPVYAVHGNHDCADPYGWFASVDAVDGRVIRLAENLLLVGIGWHGEVYVEMPREEDLEAVCRQAVRQLHRLARFGDCIVLLTHYPPALAGLFPPPREVVGPDGASRSIAQLVHDFRPVLVVQGHEHTWAGLVGRFGLGDGTETLVINPGRQGMAVIVDLATGRAAVE